MFMGFNSFFAIGGIPKSGTRAKDRGFPVAQIEMDALGLG
jgi:hypothetical protein